MELRRKQIAEALDEDNAARREVMKRAVVQAKLTHQDVKPQKAPEVLDIFKIDNAIQKLQNFFVTSSGVIYTTEDSSETYDSKIGTVILLYNSIVQIYKNPNNGPQTKHIISNKIQSVMPALQSYIIATQNRIYNAIDDINSNDDNNQYNDYLMRLLTEYAVIKKIFNNINATKYEYIDYNQVDQSLNDIITGEFNINIYRYAISKAVEQSPFSGVGQNEFAKLVKTKQDELGRQLSQTEILNLRMLVSGQRQFSPLLGNTARQLLINPANNPNVQDFVNNVLPGEPDEGQGGPPGGPPDDESDDEGPNDDGDDLNEDDLNDDDDDDDNDEDVQPPPQPQPPTQRRQNINPQFDNDDPIIDRNLELPATFFDPVLFPNPNRRRPRRRARRNVEGSGKQTDLKTKLKKMHEYFTSVRKYEKKEDLFKDIINSIKAIADLKKMKQFFNLTADEKSMINDKIDELQKKRKMKDMKNPEMVIDVEKETPENIHDKLIGNIKKSQVV